MFGSSKALELLAQGLRRIRNGQQLIHEEHPQFEIGVRIHVEHARSFLRVYITDSVSRFFSRSE
jgi:hypothetical protein